MKTLLLSTVLLLSFIVKPFAQNVIVNNRNMIGNTGIIGNAANRPAELKEQAYNNVRKSETAFTEKKTGETVEKKPFAENPWNIANIPAELKEKAHAVVRNSETVFTVKNIGEAVEKKHLVLTVLDEEGLDYASMTLIYDKLNKVNDIEGILYDANGEKVRKLKKEEIYDGSAVDNSTLFGDDRYKYAKFKYANFPFTVEFTTETTSKNLLFYPMWFPQEDEENVTVEQSSLKIIMPANMPLRYKNINGMTEPKIENVAETKTYTWQVKGMKVYENEPYAPKWTSYGKGVLTAPTEFEVEGYKGSLKTWKDMGLFHNALNKGRDVLPENVQYEVKQLVANISDPSLKVKKIYEYLQSKTRYISIQLGIGGWQPFEASYVAEKGYGDCKALSNYTTALLKTVGIESYYATIYGGSNQRDVQVDFPSQQFNHVIVCVPMKNDTIWLECTSQENAFGYLSDFTSDRYALLSTPEGGKLVHTPVYKAKDNQQNRNIKVALAEDGNATVEALTEYTGLLSDDYSEIKNLPSREAQQKSLYKTINIPSFDLTDFTIQEEKKRIPSATVKVALNVRKCASRSGTRMFLNPNLMSAINVIPPALDKPRQTEVVLKKAYIESDVVEYQLPKNASLEFKPENIKFENKFGTYQSEFQIKDGSLLYTRKFVRNHGTFPAESYSELIDFYKKVSKADRTQVVLKL
ncbi:DUF3857 domain-containing protein [Arcicella rigui]|uniref:DUF3857 domain-containing protein n=1 Tax=Arcicella rigui TaxID=797020 RepID=A0ABU5QBR1_9BACT|nr:DUF3857 domain-containing protein [Arcicella rigui]MEA5140002.1 DUF3857 domain-containing protein [Arcicella rigui]